jgi:5-methylcytosine-specific restriction endonuclease McrA
VIIAGQYNKVPLKRPRLSLKNLRERDGNRCAYTLRVLESHECSIERVVPRSKGGVTEWSNVVLADKRINNIRGNHTLEDAGLTLKVRPYVPSARPFHEIVRTNLTFPEWGFFVKKKELRVG